MFTTTAPSQSYDAHKIGDTIKGQAGDFSFSLDNAFLYNDGNHQAPIYALNQISGAGANQFDQYRNVYAHAVARERLAQTQDRATVLLQYDWDKFFVRPVASLLDYNLMTDWHNTKNSPWMGYQNYVDRYDVNGGVDLGYKLTPKLAATLGYRYGSQYQQQFPAAITSDNHYSSSDYQRVLLGLEGKPWNWLNVKLAGGPDFRSYNSLAPVNDSQSGQVLWRGRPHGDDYAQPDGDVQLQAVAVGFQHRQSAVFRQHLRPDLPLERDQATGIGLGRQGSGG